MAIRHNNKGGKKKPQNNDFLRHPFFMMGGGRRGKQFNIVCCIFYCTRVQHIFLRSLRHPTQHYELLALVFTTRVNVSFLGQKYTSCFL